MDAAISGDEREPTLSNVLEVEEAELSSSEEADDIPEDPISHDSGPGAPNHIQLSKRVSPSPDAYGDDDFVVPEEDDEGESDASDGINGYGDDSGGHTDDPSRTNFSKHGDTLADDKSRGGSGASDPDDDDEEEYAPPEESDDEDAEMEDSLKRVQYEESSDASPSDIASLTSHDGKSGLLNKDGGRTSRTKREDKLVIPEDMRNDGEYFRRSRRSRTAPSRLSMSPDESASSDDAAESDSDFEANEDIFDEDDESGSFISRKRSRSSSSRHREKQASESDDRIEISESESSDGDWVNDDAVCEPRGRSRRRARRGSKTKKRHRVHTLADDEDVARTARINIRTGRTVNYAELNDSDSDIFDSSDEAVRAAMENQELENVVSIERVWDFRNPESKAVEEKRHALTDFDPQVLQFFVKWTGKSFRRNSWHSLEELKPYKGIKRVLNYIKQFELRRDQLNQPHTPAEELEESNILMEEHRQSMSAYGEVDRIIAQRSQADDPTQSEYLVKWKNLPYSDCTWEPGTELKSEEDLKALDSFSEREQAALANSSTSGKKKFNPFNTKEERPKFRRLLEQPGYLHGEGRTLREYQLAGLNWLAFSWTKGNNVILADEMGLGKTLQTISFLGWLMYDRNIPGPFLVVVPLSTSDAWVREFARWLPDMNVVRYCGDGNSRATIRDHEFWPSQRPGSSVKFHVLLTTPELVMLDEKYIGEIRWAAIAVDEAHRLKNESSALHQTLESFRSATRLLITGTPLQNSVRELWALLHFLHPEVFNDAAEFEESFSFSALRDPERVSCLHNTLRPYIIRRQKTDVEKSLPKKFYAVLRVGMSSSQQQYYRWLLTKNFTKLNAGTKGKGMGTTITLRNLVMELKKCCNHPFLFPSYQENSGGTALQTYIRASGKMILLDKLLLRLRDKGHRVLIFSQLVGMLDILQDYCRMRGFPHQRLDGSMPNDLRQRAIDHFNAPDSVDYVFLLSTRAGGLGINLATADTVIIFDSDWNPQNDLQAESRAHRIGQTKDVKVFRLLTRESVEEDILERAKRKRVLEHLVIHGVEGDEKQNGKDGKAKMAFKKEELSAILRFGAEKLFEKDHVAGATNLDGDKGNKENDSEAPQTNDSAAPALPDQDGPDDEKAEDRRVLEVDDIDELLARVPTDETEEVGAAEPSVGDSLLNAFKWADFKTVEEEEEEEETLEPGEIVDGDVLARDAAKGIANIEDRRARDIAKATEDEAKEHQMLANEGDSEFWNRVIPETLKEEAVANSLVLGTRRRKKTRTFGSDSPEQRKRRRVTRSSKAASEAEYGILTDKEQRSLLRGLRRFGDPSRIESILKDCGLESRIDGRDAIALLESALTRAQQALDEDLKPSDGKARSNGTAGNAASKGNSHRVASQKESKSKGASRIVIDVLGETSVDAGDLIKRCNELQNLRKQIARYDVDTQFRIRRPLKAPSYGVRWLPQQDALLLVGVNRHGFGNWSRIAEDPQLSLSDKMNVAGNENFKKGAPDSTKLTRRVLTLLRDLERESHQSLPTPRSRTKKDRADNLKKVREKSTDKISRRSTGTNSKRKTRDAGAKRDGKASKKGGNLKKRRRIDQNRPDDSSSRQESWKSKLTDALKATHASTIQELRALSTEDSKMDKAEKIRRTKQCLLKLGRTIDRQAGSSQKVRNELWSYIHQVSRTSLPGDRLASIYEKVSNAQKAAGST